MRSWPSFVRPCAILLAEPARPPPPRTSEAQRLNVPASSPGRHLLVGVRDKAVDVRHDENEDHKEGGQGRLQEARARLLLEVVLRLEVHVPLHEHDKKRGDLPMAAEPAT